MEHSNSLLSLTPFLSLCSRIYSITDCIASKKISVSKIKTQSSLLASVIEEVLMGRCNYRSLVVKVEQ